MDGEDSAYVLYVDHQGHPAPLSMSYHATASRRLASAVDRHPPSTVTEVDSAYCPQCLSFHDATTGQNLGYCPKASCRLCPLCQSVTNLTVDETDCLYECGLCDWNSRQCGLYISVVVGNDGAVDNEDFEKAAEDLGMQWATRMEQKNQFAEEHFKSMSKTLEAMAKEQVKGQRSSLFALYASGMMRRGRDGPEGWSVQSLEESLVDRRKLIANAIAENVGGHDLQFVSLVVDETLDESLEDKPAQSLLLQRGGTASTSMNDLLPLPVPLRPRKSRRCRAELAEGRPGILVKPKLNPLEGDSSLRTGHGQWWKKDSSAIQVIPRVRVSIHASDEVRHAFLLKVSNPTLGTIRFRLGPSKYAGEPEWNEKSQTTPVLEKILVDPFTQQLVDATLILNVANQLESTEVCQLEPAEDSFLELGKSSNEEPEAVAKWDAGDVLVDSKVSPESSLSSTLRLVGHENSCAWFELVLLESKVGKGMSCAIPLALEIEVGNGSWESSLIQPEPQEGSDMRDSVTFDLVIIWDSLE